jgi:hypothetical protein
MSVHEFQMTVLSWCEWIQYSPPLVQMRLSPWFFPLVASIHLMGLATIGGSVLLVDLRLLGFGLSRQPIAQLARDAERWLRVGLWVTLPTGLLLFMCFATKYYWLTAFWVKVASLVMVLAFTFSIKRRLTRAAETASPLQSRLVALVSITLWTSVALGGRLIGFP